METLKTKINEQITTATEENSINPLILGSLMEETVDGILDIVVPTEISELNNDVGYITLAEVPSVYVPIEISELNNDVGYITLAEVPAGFDGNYNSLMNKPFIPVDTNDLTNGAGFITISQVPVIDLSPYATINYVNGVVGGLVIPTRTSDLVNNSGFITLSDLTWTNISGKPNLFSGNYNDLSNKPTIPTNNNQLTNGAGYITLAQVPTVDLSPYATTTYVDDSISELDIPTQITNLNQIPNRSYDDLQDLPTIPTNNNQLANGAGYITLNDVPTELSGFNNDIGFITLSEVPAGFSGDYDDLSNKPFIPVDVSDLNNDLNFIDLSDLTWVNISGKPTLFSGDYDDLNNKPAIPTNNNQLANGAGYITLNDVQPEDIDINDSDIISFNEPQIYGSYLTPRTGAITFELTDAKVGMIQELYHSGVSMPTLPASAKIVNDIEYSDTKVNLLLFKYIDVSRVEVVISVLEN